MAYLYARPAGDQEVAGLIPTSFVEIDREVFFTVILAHRPIQEVQLSFLVK